MSRVTSALRLAFYILRSLPGYIFLLLGLRLFPWIIGKIFTPRRPVTLAAIGVGATLVLALIITIALLRTGGPKAISGNAALIGALVAVGGVFTTQLANIGLEAQRAHETALQNYFEQVGNLLLKHSLRDPVSGADSSTVARAQTLAVLEDLDPVRKRILLQFLNESSLIKSDKPVFSLDRANLRRANLRGADLSKTDLSGANLRQAKLTFLILSGANLSEADLRYADLRLANLRGANLQGANLFEANLSWPKSPLPKTDLSGADLQRANLQGANLSGANLSGVNLQGANLSRGYLPILLMPRTDLRGADLSGADLRGADLRGANLRGANLSKANLQGANLSSDYLPILMPRTDLRGADLSGTELSDAELRETDLREANNLTKEQINKATGDEHTQLPDHLQRPTHWSKSDEERGVEEPSEPPVSASEGEGRSDAPPEPREEEDPETVSAASTEEGEGVETPLRQEHRSWWRRLFGG